MNQILKTKKINCISIIRIQIQILKKDYLYLTLKDLATLQN